MPTYRSLYSDFDSDLSREIRSEAYGRDIGQQSWVTAGEIEAAIPRLALGAGSRLLDIGCGPGGPLGFVVEKTGCAAVGLDLSDEAVAAARERLPASVAILKHDANLQLPFGAREFDAVMSIDAVLHIRDRARLFRDVARVLRPGGRFWFTDAAVVTGAISNAEIAARSPLGVTHFAPTGFNEVELGAAGFVKLDTEDRTESVIANASGRIAARIHHRADLLAHEGEDEFERQQQYLESVLALAQSRALSRISYMAIAP